MSTFLSCEEVAELTDVRQYIIRPTSEPTDIRGDCDITGSGIYALFAKDDMLLYIGKASQLSARLYTHFLDRKYGRKREYASFVALSVPEEIYSDIEIAHIYALMPPLNRLYEPPKHSRHLEMVEQIKGIWAEVEASP